MNTRSALKEIAIQLYVFEIGLLLGVISLLKADLRAPRYALVRRYMKYKWN